MKAKKLRQALVELAEEGVVQLFRPQDGAAPLVGVVGTLQLDVLQARLGAEYGVKIGFEASSFALARWVSPPTRRRWRSSSARTAARWPTMSMATRSFWPPRHS